MPSKRIPPEPLPAHTIPHDQVRVYVQGMAAKTLRQQSRSALLPGVPPDPAAGQKLFSSEQAAVMKPDMVLDRSCVILDRGITSWPTAVDHIDLAGLGEAVAVLPRALWCGTP